MVSLSIYIQCCVTLIFRLFPTRLLRYNNYRVFRTIAFVSVAFSTFAVIAAIVAIIVIKKHTSASRKQMHLLIRAVIKT